MPQDAPRSSVKVISVTPSNDHQEKDTVPSPANEPFKLPLPRVENNPEALDAQLLAVANRALGKADEILRAPFDSNNGVLTRAQTAIVNAALATQVRVDESRLRARSPDVMAKLLEMIAEEEAKLPPLRPIEEDVPNDAK